MKEVWGKVCTHPVVWYLLNHMGHVVNFNLIFHKTAAMTFGGEDGKVKH